MSDDQGDNGKRKPIPLIKLAKRANVPVGGSDAPKPKFTTAQHKGTPVRWSEDLDRVLALPRREPLDLASPRAQAMVDLITARYSKGVPSGACNCRAIDPNRFLDGANGCITEVLPAQAWTLYETGLAGGCVGSIVVGGGKCAEKSTVYMDYRSGLRRFVDEPGEVSVATFEKTLRVGAASAFPSGSKPCVEFRLADGSSAKFSHDHKILTHRGWVEASHLIPGKDFATVAVEMPDVAITQASDAEVCAVAYFLSDGSCSQKTLCFTQMPGPVLDDWRRTLKVLQMGVGTLCAPGVKSKAGTYNVTGPHVTAFRDRWGLHGLSKDKRTHASIWGLPRKHVALFLNRFWACDGHVSKRGLECTLASEGLIDDLRFLCSRLGIRTRKQYKKASYVNNGVRHSFDAWRISMRGEAALKFLTEVGDVLGKETACQILREQLETTARNTNYDLVPVSYKEVTEICDELGYPRRSETGRKKGRRLRTDVRKFLGATPGQYVSRDKFVDFCRQWNYTGRYAHLATTDVAWEKVVDVKDIGVHPVYDLTVPGTHNFVANGIVVHNTLLDILAIFPLGVKTALTLIPSNLMDQFYTDYRLLREHFRVPSLIMKTKGKREMEVGEPELHVLPYGQLCRPKYSGWIDELKPEAVICDEGDKLADLRGSATARRVMRYFVEATAAGRRPRCAAWTGSLSDKRVQEYCLDPSTRVLRRDLTWTRVDTLSEGDELVGFDEQLKTARMKPATVQAVKLLRQPRVKITTTRGTVVCSDTHKWVLKGRSRTYEKRGYSQIGWRTLTPGWIDAKDVRPGDMLGYYVEPWETLETHESGYLAGLLDGEGWVDTRGYVGFSQNDGPILEQFKTGLNRLGIPYAVDKQDGGRGNCKRVLPNGNLGGMRLLGQVRPVRLLQKSDLTWVGKRTYGKYTRHARVLDVEALPEGDVVAVQTSTGTLIADGFLSHNCHIMVMALGEQAPVPLDPAVVEEWGNALNVMEQRADPGALRAFCDGDEDVRRGFGRRLAETLGVITTSETNVERMGQGGIIKGSKVEIVIQSKSAPPVPEIVHAAMESVRANVRPDSWFGAPDDEELDSPMEVQRSVMEIACGVMNVWEFHPTTPDRTKFVTHACGQCEQFNASCAACMKRSIERGGVPQEREVVEAWYEARKPWNKATRLKCIEGVSYMDSPYLCEQAAMRAYGDLEIPPCPDGEDPQKWELKHPVWDCPFWPAWRDIKKQVKPKPVSKRVHTYLAEDAAKWALENNGIVWYSLVEFGRMVAEISDLPMYGGGTNAARLLKNERGARSIIASIDAHGRGRNGLQFLFDEQLLCQVPSSSRRWEQLLGRLIRRGQRAEQVLTWVYTHVPELRKAVESAVKRSEYVEDTLRMRMKLLSGWRG